jgi:colanic acid/amylovoran biosynthesis protein
MGYMAKEISKRILILNIHSSRNLGDAALLQVTLQQIQSRFPSSNITLSMDDPASYRGNERVMESIVAWIHPKKPDGSIRWNYANLLWVLPGTLLPILSYRFFKKAIYILTPRPLRLIIETYNQADIVLSEPGGFLYSSGRGISLFITVFSIALAIFALKPIYILPQSIGPFKRNWERKMIRWMTNHVRIVMVREPISFRTIQFIGGDQKKVRLVPDLAFALPLSDRALGLQWLHKLGIDPQDNGPLMGMTLINWGEQNKDFKMQQDYEKACADAIKWFIENTGGKVLLFPQVIGPYASQDDRVPARRVANLLSELSDSVHQIEQPLSLELIKAVYSWMDIFIGTRMHSNIFALSEGVPVVAIGYLPKAQGITEMIGFDELFLNIQEVRGNVLVDRVMNLWKNHQYWKAIINKVIPGLIKESTKVGDWVKEDYENWIQEKK